MISTFLDRLLVIPRPFSDRVRVIAALASFDASTERLGQPPYAMRIHDPNPARDNGKGLASDGPVDDIAMVLIS